MRLPAHADSPSHHRSPPALPPSHLVQLDARELGVVAGADALIPEDAPDLEDALQAADLWGKEETGQTRGRPASAASQQPQGGHTHEAETPTQPPTPQTELTTRRFRCSSVAMRSVKLRPRVLWYVEKGRASAPPADDSRTGVSTSRKSVG